MMEQSTRERVLNLSLNLLAKAAGLKKTDSILTQKISSPQSENSDFKIDGAVLFAYKGTERHLIVPQGVEVIGKNAFFKNVFLKSLVLPNSLRTIESNAFFGCKNLENVTLENQITFIGDFAFADCIRVKTINIPDSVKHIGKYAFSYVFGNSAIKALQNKSTVYVELPKSIEIIGEGSFLGSDGIIIYDNFYAPSKTTENPFDNATVPVTKSQLGSALYDPDNASGHWIGSVRFKPHLIMIKSSQTNQIQGAVWMASKDEQQEYLAAIMRLWETRKSFDFEKYDGMFNDMVSINDKVNVAFYRLQYPHELRQKYKDNYEEFFKKQAVKAIEIIDYNYKLKVLQLLAKKNMLTAENIDLIFEKLNNDGNTKCVSWVMTYKNKNRLQNDYRLKL